MKELKKGAVLTITDTGKKVVVDEVRLSDKGKVWILMETGEVLSPNEVT